MDNLERHLTFKEIAALTSNTPDWARRAWKRGEFGTQYLDLSMNCSGKEIRIPESAVRAYLERRCYTLATAAGAAEKIAQIG
jgi:hypothetical protein